MPDTQFLDNFENVLRDGIVKVCRSWGLLSGDKLRSTTDITDKWRDEYLQEYMGDAVENFNSYPESTIAWPGFLGMAVANRWDDDWKTHSFDRYQDYYGSRGFDDMDEHILADILHLKEDYAAKVSDAMSSCAVATLGLIKHEGIEAQTAQGFYVLVRAYSVMFEIGAAIELERLGYRMVKLDSRI